VTYTFEATARFWKEFRKLGADERASARAAFKIFKANPFDPRLGTHRIAKLSAHARHPIFSAVVENNLRVIFRIDGQVVTSLDIGSHDIYK